MPVRDMPKVTYLANGRTKRILVLILHETMCLEVIQGFLGGSGEPLGPLLCASTEGLLFDLWRILSFH